MGVADLLTLLSNWEPCLPTTDRPIDFNADGTVGILDLLTLLANWGPCA